MAILGPFGSTSTQPRKLSKRLKRSSAPPVSQQWVVDTAVRTDDGRTADDGAAIYKPETLGKGAVISTSIVALGGRWLQGQLRATALEREGVSGCASPWVRLSGYEVGAILQSGGHQFTKHQRTRSATAAVVYRSRYDQSFLIPAPPAPSSRRNHNMSVMAPGPIHTPHAGGFAPSLAGRDSMAREFAMRGKTNNIIMTPNGPMPAPMPQRQQQHQPMRAAPRSPGSYAQFDNRPVTYDRNGRPLSSSSNSTVMTRDSYDARMRSPASSRTSFESWDSHPRRPEHGWQRPAPIKQYRRRALQPGEQFAALPDEVLDLIMSELRKSHLREDSFSCATCMMRDLCSVALSSRRLLHVARKALYEDILLVGSDSQLQKKRYKINHGSRMVLLRRTLRANPRIAAVVHSLKVPTQPQGMAIDQYTNLIASLIMACPNFERLIGPHQTYDHSFSRLFHALSTREKLQEMTWVVEASATQRQLRRRPTDDTEPEDLLPQQSTAFLDLNMHWPQLTTLSIHCLPGAALTPVSPVATAISTMPALQQLNLSGLSRTCFDDRDLLSLPPLGSLSLSHLPGITASGLATYVTRQSSQSLRSLTLQHMNLDSLQALGRIFLNLKSLETLNLVQAVTPVLAEGEMIWLYPYLASNSLKRLHWDITSHETCANIADSILAKSIAANGFPSLRLLRAPNDPEGIFQNLCRPVDKIEKPSDKYRGRGLVATIDAGPTTPKTPTTPSKSPFKTPSTPFFAALDEPKPSSNLQLARRAAQSRLEDAREEPRWTVNVIEEDGEVVESWGMAGFMGEIGSPIHYCLLPDPGASDENGGLVLFSDILNEGREDLNDKEGCTGRWNHYGYVTAERKDKEKWWHTERARWTEVRLPC
ncbi:hypothetical protein JX265_004601 [Neoarthrinium moseri]|uniref:F-box domain-containing protein n=1 Tax=Neoarthrinium moseri TaxID=1658444 RepID=A0A9P9WPY4_9PEZI|nr:hypothetical protein JX265_004601 [Neoarthrinium moseri]